MLGTFIIIMAGCSNSKDNENSKQSSKSTNNSDNPKTELKVSAAASLSDVSKALKERV